MKLIISFAIFIALYLIFDRIIKRTDVYKNLLNGPRGQIYIIILLLVAFAFSLEYGKQLLNEKYGVHNYISTIISAFLGSIYINFFYVIYRRIKQGGFNESK